MRLSGWAAFLMVFCAGVAQASPDSDALAKFGLIGSWAIDCKAPSGPSNPFQVFTPSTAGEPTRQLITGNAAHDSMVPVRDVVRLDGDHLQLSFAQAGIVVTVVLLKEKGRIRPMTSRINGGSVLVEGGIALRNGQETTWLQKCPD
jgi:hypothetical protein